MNEVHNSKRNSLVYQRYLEDERLNYSNNIGIVQLNSIDEFQRQSIDDQIRVDY